MGPGSGIDPGKRQGVMVNRVPRCLHPALQLPPCHAGPTGPYIVVTSGTEIPAPGLVSGCWMPESRYDGVAVALQLACSGWLKVMECGISLWATWIWISSPRHPPVYFCLPASLLCPHIHQAWESFPCRVRSWHFGRQHLIPTQQRAESGVC